MRKLSGKIPFLQPVMNLNCFRAQEIRAGRAGHQKEFRPQLSEKSAREVRDKDGRSVRFTTVFKVHAAGGRGDINDGDLRVCTGENIFRKKEGTGNGVKQVGKRRKDFRILKFIRRQTGKSSVMGKFKLFRYPVQNGNFCVKPF